METALPDWLGRIDPTIFQQPTDVRSLSINDLPTELVHAMASLLPNRDMHALRITNENFYVKTLATFQRRHMKRLKLRFTTQSVRYAAWVVRRTNSSQKVESLILKTIDLTPHYNLGLYYAFTDLFRLLSSLRGLEMKAPSLHPSVHAPQPAHPVPYAPRSDITQALRALGVQPLPCLRTLALSGGHYSIFDIMAVLLSQSTTLERLDFCHVGCHDGPWDRLVKFVRDSGQFNRVQLSRLTYVGHPTVTMTDFGRNFRENKGVRNSRPPFYGYYSLWCHSAHMIGDRAVRLGANRMLQFCNSNEYDPNII